MSARHYWLGRVHGMREARAIVEKCLRLGMDPPSALDTVEEIADDIRFDLGQGDGRMLAARFTARDAEELPDDLFQEVRRRT
ncbi:MAG: hypothetical protein IPM30_14845 [Burkholderiales bacterium]|nr:hypothetical protein [Burkholderiales bacterium]